MAAELLVLFFIIVSEPLFYETNVRDVLIWIDSDNCFVHVVKSTQGVLAYIGGKQLIKCHSQIFRVHVF